MTLGRQKRKQKSALALVVESFEIPVTRILYFVPIQMGDDAITHLKYLFQFSSILERTQNGKKTNNTSFESSDNGHLKS